MWAYDFVQIRTHDGRGVRLLTIMDAYSRECRAIRAGRVEVRLDFETDCIRLSVSDDGVGLPEDYAERGRGFRGMRADAERLGGRLIVETGPGPAGNRTPAGAARRWTTAAEESCTTGTMRKD